MNKEPKIEEIEISSEDIAKLKGSIKRSYAEKHRVIRRYMGGYCTICQGIPKFKVSYDINGAQLVDWYCAICWQKHKSTLNKRLQNMNFA